MNERVKKLAEQAGHRYIPSSNSGSLRVEYLTPEIEKFAELIVRECAEIALEQKKWVEDQKVHNPEDESWNKARIQQSQHIVDKIKLHFGVE